MIIFMIEFMSSSRQQRITQHRGWPVSKSDHILLIQWAISCIERSIELSNRNIDDRMTAALVVARSWCEWWSSVWDARSAAIQCHLIARESTDLCDKYIARWVGHAVATAHMADHALWAAEYALIVLAYIWYTINQLSEAKERQNTQLSSSIKQLVLDARKSKHVFWDKQINKALR